MRYVKLTPNNWFARRKPPTAGKAIFILVVDNNDPEPEYKAYYCKKGSCWNYFKRDESPASKAWIWQFRPNDWCGHDQTWLTEDELLIELL